MVEHVNSQFVSYPSVISAGRRLWVLVDLVVAVQFRPAEDSLWCNGSTPGNSTVALLPALFDDRLPTFLMGRRHRVICHWFDSNPGHHMPR